MRLFKILKNPLKKKKKFDVYIEVGHKATLKETPDSNGNTHKWNAFVRAGDQAIQQKLDIIVKKVVFNLHETFKNPTRQCTTQPYCVRECGYGQFEFPIDIYFNGIDTKYSINYYLELPSLNCTQPLSRIRKEIITFINPSAEFRKVLIEGGAVLHRSSGGGTAEVNVVDASRSGKQLKQSTPSPGSSRAAASAKLNNSSLSNTSISSTSSVNSPGSASLSTSLLTPEKKLNMKKVVGLFKNFGLRISIDSIIIWKLIFST